ncbi:SH3 domain-containing protein [Fodinibius roseus]|uniref:SH3 domain-containing protein n=1 Tax=Fodinibius roseus TaxID=1194090 RepID=A0A1M5CM31_9BACT|nr:C40 family peptidase [Fodinibius roseus]SHF55778.1 SH3 domain-containing protein [Fodinibius roseus]
MRSLPKLLSAALLLLATGSGCDPEPKPEVEQVIENTKVHFAPDSRVALFEVQAEEINGEWLLKGETTISGAKAALLDSLSALELTLRDSIRVLPAADLEGQTYAIVNNSVANIRSRPAHPAQLATQALLGMPLLVLKKEGGWYLVKTPDDYLSWVDGGGIEQMNRSHYKAWKDAPKLIYLKTYGFSYREPDESSGKVSDLVAGSLLRLEGQTASFYEVSYPDGRRGYVPAREAKPFEEWNEELDTSQASLIETSKTMMGAPYLWGGTSTKGMDCSGFTKTIYFMNGMILPRDASQQIKAGALVDNQKNFDQLQAGDLLFFGRPATKTEPRRVVHVGMWIGEMQFIHSSGRVHVSSVDSSAENFDPYNLDRYLESRRYLDHRQGNIILTADMYNW